MGLLRADERPGFVQFAVGVVDDGAGEVVRARLPSRQVCAGQGAVHGVLGQAIAIRAVPLNRALCDVSVGN